MRLPGFSLHNPPYQTLLLALALAAAMPACKADPPPPPPPAPLVVPEPPAAVSFVEARAQGASETVALFDGATDVPVEVTLHLVLAGRLTDVRAILLDARERPIPSTSDWTIGAQTRLSLRPERLNGSSRYRLEITAERGEHLVGADGKRLQDFSLSFQTRPAPPAPKLKRRSKKRR